MLTTHDHTNLDYTDRLPKDQRAQCREDDWHLADWWIRLSNRLPADVSLALLAEDMR